MNWQQHAYFLAGAFLGGALVFAGAQSCVKQLKERIDWLRVALCRMMRVAEQSMPEHIKQIQMQAALDFSKMVLDGKTPREQGDNDVR